MLIENYFQEINNLVSACQFVRNFELIADKRSGYGGFIRGNIYFLDNSLLHLREFVNVKNGIYRGKYAYQYMDAANNLIFRYDNAQHHQKLNLANYPHHKHQGSEDNIISSDAPMLADILLEIEELFDGENHN